MKASLLWKHDDSLQVLQGNNDKAISSISRPAFLEKETLAFIKNSKFLKQLTDRLTAGPQPEAAVVLDQKLWDALDPVEKGTLQKNVGTILIGPNVQLSLTKLSKPLHDEKFEKIQSVIDGRQMGNTDIHPSALVAQGVFIGEHVKIAPGVKIHPGCVIQSHVDIGEGCEIFAGVCIYPFTYLGKNVRVHANTTIGSDGFGYVFDKGIHHKIWHMGGVHIHNDVEIGANCSIDQGTFSPTVIGSGTRIDNLVQIAHNVQIGKGCIICGQCGVAGSAVLEDYVVLGGRAAVGPEAHIGQGTQIAGGAKVNEGAVWPKGSVLGGHPARDLKEWMKTFAWVRKNALKS